MKVPKNIKGREVLKLLEEHYGYQMTRQVGSNVRNLFVVSAGVLSPPTSRKF